MNKTIKFVAVMLCLASFSLFYSCNIKRQAKANSMESKIFTAEDFSKFANHTDLYEINDVIQCMSEEKVKRLLDEYKSYFNDSYPIYASKPMVKSYAYLWISAMCYYIPETDDFYEWLEDYNKEGRWFITYINCIGGEDGLAEVRNEYIRECVKHSQLYKGVVLPVRMHETLQEKHGKHW